MKILVVGGGGREHALAWRLAQSPVVTEVLASPGNPGMGKAARLVPAPASVEGYADLAEFHQIDLTVVGPEAPLVAGIVDTFRQRNLLILGPTQAAARLESSKLFAKEFFATVGIPTARSGRTLSEFSFPVVIKADGLFAGKGVVIAHNAVEASAALARLGPQVVIEEFLEGEEVSFIGVANGRDIEPFLPSQDHKRLLAGDQGPNTGGMGAYVDSRILTAAQTGVVMDRIMLPAIAEMNKAGKPFSGFLYAGLMMTAEGPKLLEFNVRLGDPETQALLHHFQGDLASALYEAARGERISFAPSAAGCSVCVVLAAEGYPDQPRKGDAISGIEEAEAAGAMVFQAGTTLSGSQLVTSGGRVLGVTAGGSTLPTAISNAYQAVSHIRFDGMQFRQDIGQKGLRRW